MRLKSVSYKRIRWQVKDLEFESVCLIVGRNATGKTRVLVAIDLLAKIINQKRPPTGQWTVSFILSGGQHFEYSFAVHSRSNLRRDVLIKSEEIKLDGVLVLRRLTSDSAEIYNAAENRMETINPPPSKL